MTVSESTVGNAVGGVAQKQPEAASLCPPASRRWRVDRFHSYLLGQTFAGTMVPRRVHPLEESREWQIWTELVTVTICHQANWDKLQSRIVEIARTALTLITPAAVSEMTGPAFRRLFGQVYDSDRIRSTERAKLLSSLGRAVARTADVPVFPWLTSNPVALAGPGGLYDWLAGIDAFSQDPLRKKSRILVHDLLQHGLIEVADQQNIAPAIDYHLIRLYVRTGRVLPIRVELLGRLSDEGTPRVEFHTDLRAAVEEAMGYTASGAGLRIDELNNIEWQVARSFCLRKEPRCNGCAIPEKPVDAFIKVLAGNANGCPMRRECRGANDAELRSIVDPRSARSYY